jgi:hypothetical protein
MRIPVRRFRHTDGNDDQGDRGGAQAQESGRMVVATDDDAGDQAAHRCTEATEAQRMLIERVVLTPDPAAPDGLAAELRGDLVENLALAATPEARGRRVGAKNSPERRLSGSQLSLVAGARNQRSHHSTVPI